jgi:NAD(P)H-nitrite reductase large subunit
MPRHVIVGNGPAGVVAAETIRKAAPDDPITLIGDEPEPPYSRMAIPYLLAGGIGEEGTHLRKGAGHYDRLKIDQLVGRVTAVDTRHRLVTIDGARHLPYDRLLLACGSVPGRPPIPGLDGPGVQHCWTLEDARRIAASVGPGSRVLQLGAGFIGCIIMEAIQSRGAALTVVEIADRMLARTMTHGGAALIKRWCEAKGVRVLTETKIVAVERSGGVLRAVREHGEPLETDVIICATGVAPKVEFLTGSGIAVRSGIVVDKQMRSSVEDVYAAGDCTESEDIWYSRHILNAVQPAAVDQARIAALNMAGRHARSLGTLQMNVLDTFGLVSTSYGEWQGVKGGDHVELADEGRFRYLRLEFAGDVLAGATALGLTEHVGVMRGLIQARLPLGRWKGRLLEDPTRLVEAYLSSGQAASA